MSNEDGRGTDDDFVDHTFTRVLSKQFEIDGVTFSWWAVKDTPALVTVTTQWFGSRVGLTEKEPATFARELARQILSEHYDRISRLRSRKPEKQGF